jgi:hypothetical protein
MFRRAASVLGRHGAALRATYTTGSQGERSLVLDMQVCDRALSLCAAKRLLTCTSGVGALQQARSVVNSNPLPYQMFRCTAPRFQGAMVLLVTSLISLLVTCLGWCLSPL